MRESGGGRCGHGSCLGKDDLGIARIRQHVILVSAVTRINQKIKTTIRILHFGEEICFPFRFLQDVALTVPAFGQTQIIQIADAREHISGKNEEVNERSAIDRVFAIIAGIVVAAAQIDGSLVDEGIKTGSDILQLRRRVA